MASQSALINVMQKASTAASRGLLRDFGEVENQQFFHLKLLDPLK